MKVSFECISQSIIRLEENKKIDWNIKRSLTKMNYRIHTDAIKQNQVAISQMNILTQDESLKRMGNDTNLPTN